MRAGSIAAVLAGFVTLASATASFGAAGSPQALVVLPPGNGDTVTLSDWLANQAEGGCGGLGPNFCDQLTLYMNWGFRQGPLARSPAEVPAPVSSEQPRTGVRVVHDTAGVPHVFGAGPDPQTIQERLAFGTGYAQA